MRATSIKTSEVERRTIGKVTRRLVPLLVLCYFVAYLDRVNVGFAKLEMDAALGLSETAYGFGAGVFFLAYFFFEIPSNLALERFGARRWIARIMLSWGVASGLFAFIAPIARASGTSNATVFYALRCLLGIAEAGFFPGIIFFLTLWFPARYCSRIVAMFMLAIPFSSIVGAPLSGALLSAGGLGLASWQWLFLLEALPSILISLCVLRYLTDSPSQASWLGEDERRWLRCSLDAEQSAKAAEHVGIVRVIVDARVLACAFAYFCLAASSYGVGFFVPTIVKSFGVTDFQTGLLSALPFVCGAVGMLLLGWNSDRTSRRKEHIVVAMLLAAIGVAGAGIASSPVMVLSLLCVGQVGVSAMPPLFWPVPNAFLSGSAAAAGIASINAFANLAGFLGPYLMGSVKDLTGSFDLGLMLLGGLMVIGAIVIALLRIDARGEASARLDDAAPLAGDGLV